MEEKKYIELGESTNVLRLWLRTKKGEETGECLTFNLKDLSLIDNLDKCQNEINKNQRWIQSELVIIDKKQDFQKKGSFMTNNEWLKYNAFKKFYKDQLNAFEIFLGKDGVEKLLNGRPVEWETINEIETIIKEQIAPNLKINMKDIQDEIKNKYKVSIGKVDEDIEVVE